MSNQQAMTARERVLATVEHREPDRLAVDLGATPSSGISAVAHANLVRHLGLADQQTRVYDVVQQLAQPSDELLDHFRIDVVDIGRTFNDRRRRLAPHRRCRSGVDGPGARLVPPESPGRRRPGTAFDASGGRIAAMPMGANFFDQTYFPYLDGYPDDLSGLADVMPKVLWSGLGPQPVGPRLRAGLLDPAAPAALALRASTDRALMVVVGCNLFEWGTFLRRIDNFLMDLAIDQAECRAAAGGTDGAPPTRRSTRCVAAVGDVADVIRFGDDLGMDRGPLMSPVTYRKSLQAAADELMTNTCISTAA